MIIDRIIEAYRASDAPLTRERERIVEVDHAGESFRFAVRELSPSQVASVTRYEVRMLNR